ncbi:MAG TPA: CvpA family protein [Candidatus Limnocylindrales bacterium]
MDIAEFLRSIDPFDLLVVLVLAALFILGFIQGTIRRVLGILSIVFSFFLAANMREPMGDFLAPNWTQFPPEYSQMVGFATVFVAACVAFSITIQAFYKKVPLFEKYTVVDELLGGTLGVVQGVLLLGAMVVILDSFFVIPGIAQQSTELPLLREMFNAYNGSMTAGLFRDNLIPTFFAITSPLIPGDLRGYFPGS